MFSLDSVFKIENGEEIELGDFVEIRTTEKKAENEIKDVISKLGLEMEDGIKEAYVEM